MGRRPTARSRWASQGGEGRTVSPVMTRAQKRGQRSGASISTRASAAASASPSFTAIVREAEGRAGERRDLARHAHHRERVGPVRA